jgi:hypothetical protein
MVILDLASFSVSPTARLAMLMPLLANDPAIRPRTPAWFRTRQEIVCFVSRLIGPPLFSCRDEPLLFDAVEAAG